MREATGCVTVDSSNLSLLSGALQEWQEDAEVGSLMVAALSDGRAVSVCSSVHASKFVHCAGVETAPEHRGFGFASLAVTGWASLVREHGAEPFYATTFDNIASQRVARSLGLSVVGSEFSIYGKALRQS